MNVPKIRFETFTEEWRETSIGQVAHIIGGGTPSTSNIHYWGGDIQWFTPSEVGHCKYVNKSERTISELGLNESSAKLLPTNSILLSSRATIGEMSINTCECATNQGFQSLVPYNADLEFLFYIMHTKKNDLIRESNGSTFLEISANKVRSLGLVVPKRNEQEKIGLFLKNLDSSIETLSKKITSLKQTKQACLQSMFPQPGETKPRIRFRGFEGAWQLRKIGELGTTYSGLSGKSKADFGLGSAQYITFLNVLTNAHIDTTIFESVNIKPGEKQNKVIKGDILFNTSSETPEEVGYCSVLMKDVENLYLNSFCFGFRPYAGTIDPEFMVYLMRGQIGRSIMKILAQGATRYNLSKNRLCEVTIPIPANDEEQQQIAAFFSNMDKQIRIQEQRLEKLKRIKTACLENMFV